MKYFDTHAHIIEQYYTPEEIKKHIENAKNIGVKKILIPGCTKEDSFEAIKRSNGINIFASIGIHPNDAKVGDTDFMRKIDLSKVIAIGECGIDLHYEDNPSLSIQTIVFEKQLDLAVKNNLPAIIHMRDATQEVYNIINQEKYKDLKFVLHSFSENIEWANKFIQLGAYISFSGVVTFKNAKITQEAAKKIKLDRILVETDSPYLTPTPNRGKKNLPEYVKHTADYIASIRNEDDQVVCDAFWKNSHMFFNLKE